MRIEKASSSKFKNFDKTITVPTLDQFLGAKKTTQHKLLRMYDENTFQMLTEQLQGVYGVGKAGVKGVEGRKYNWAIKGMPDYTTTVTINSASDFNLGRNQQEFTICLAEPIANSGDLLILENEQTLFVLNNAVTLASGKYQYRVKVQTNDINQAVDFSYLQIGRTISVVGNLQPELSREGYISLRENKEERVNYLFKARAGVEISGESAMEKYYVCEGDEKSGLRPAMIITKAEDEVLRQCTFNKEKMLLFNKSTVNPNNDQVILTNSRGEDIMGGDGIIETLRKDGMTIFYNRLTETILRNAIMHIISKNPYKKASDINLVIMTGIQGMVQFDNAMRGILQGATDLTYLYDKEGTKVKVGASFTEYRYLDATIKVVRNPVFDDRTGIADGVDNQGYPLRSSMMLIMDMSTYDGVPNVQVVSREGVGIIKSTVKGVGGMSGHESGEVSSPVHASRHDVIMYGGVIVHYPETCIVLRKSLI